MTTYIPITGLELGTPLGGDYIPGVDVLDTTQSQNGSTKKYQRWAEFNYVLNALGSRVFTAPRVATTANLNATYNNGTGGVGAQLINNGAQVAIAIDGITLSFGDIVCVKNQSSAFQNGIYQVLSVGGNTTNWILSRAGYYDATVEIEQYDTFLIIQGTVNAGIAYQQTAAAPITVGYSDITFAPYNINDVYAVVPVVRGGTGETSYVDGQLLIGRTAGNTLVKNTLTAGTGITIQNLPGEIVISTAASAFVTSVSGVTNRTTASPTTGAVVVDIAAGYEGQTSINKLGTVNTGTWNGTTIAAGFGGTGQTIYADHDFLVGRASDNSLVKTQFVAGSGISINYAAGLVTFAATGGTGTVTSVGISGANGIGVSGAPITTSGTIALSLGAITPSSVAASGTVTGSNLSGTNTGDQVISGTANRITAVAAGTNYTIDISGAYVGQSSITTVGTVTSGVWNSTAIGVPFGGTGQTSYTDGQLLIGNSSGNTLTKATLTAGSNISITNGSGSITIAATGVGSVTSVAVTGANGIGVSGSPITSSGTIALSLGTITGSTWNGNVISTTYTQAQIISVSGTTDRITIGGTATVPVVDIASTYVGQASITTLGTISTGVWQGSSISTTYTDAKVKTVTGTANEITITGTAFDPIFSISTGYLGQVSIISLGTISTGTWNGSVIAGVYGGTGVANSGRTINITGGTTGDVLVRDGSGNAAWSTIAPGGVTSVAGTTNRITVSPTTGNVIVDISASYVGQASITTLGTITTGAWNGTSISTTYTDAKIKTVTGTSNRITIGGTATDPTFDIAGTYVGQNSITTLGTIATGVWQGTAVDGTYINFNATNLKVTSNALNTIQDIAAASSPTFANITITTKTTTATFQLTTSPTAGYVLTSDASGNGTWVLPGSATVTSVSGTTDRITASPTTGAVVVDIAATYVGQTSITTLGTIATGVWTGTTIAVARGGTGQTSYTDGQLLIGNTTGNTLAKATLTAGTGITVTNGSGTITLAADAAALVTSVSGTANRITVSPTVGAAVVDISAAYVGQASITTLGTIATGTWNASVISLVYGGTNANLTASNGGIVYSTASAFAILAGTATAGQILRSGSSAAPSWSTATYPATTVTNQLLYSSATNTVGGITAANNGVLISSAAGVPSWLAAGTTGQVLIATTSNPASWGTLSSIAVTSVSGTANQITVTPTTGAAVASLTNGISIGSYQATTPPTGGLILPGIVGIGTNSPTADEQVNITSTKAINLYLTGNKTATTGSGSQYGINIDLNFAPTAGPAVVYGQQIVLTMSPPLGITIPFAYGFITNPYANSGSGTVERCYGAYIRAPIAGTVSNTALYADNFSVGYQNITPPTNGMIVTGQSGFGTSAPGNGFVNITSALTASGGGAVSQRLGGTLTASANTDTFNNLRVTTTVLATTASSYNALTFYNITVLNNAVSKTGNGVFTNAYGVHSNGFSSIATNQYSGYFSAPTGGTVNTAIYSDNLVVGSSYVTTTPPSNGAIIQGNVGIGTSSAANLLTIGTINTALGEAAKINGTMASQSYFSFYGNTTRQGYIGTAGGSGGLVVDSDVTSLLLQGNTVPVYLSGTYTGISTGASIGVSYYTITPPSNGIIVQGQSAFGTNTPNSSSQVNIQTTGAYGLILTGTQTANASGDTNSLRISSNLVPTTTSTYPYAAYIAPGLGIASGLTAPEAGGAIIIPFFSANVGTVQAAFGLQIAAGNTAGTVNAGYGLYARNPGFGTTKCAVYADNLSIGYTGVTPPSSGAIISGTTLIGSASNNPSSALMCLTTPSSSYRGNINCTGTITQSSTSLEYGLYVDIRHSPTANALCAGISIYPAITTGGGVTVPAMYGLWIQSGDSASTTNQPTVGYNLYAAAPSFGTTRVCAYMENLAIGSYTGIAPPSNGAIISGNVGMGTSSVNASCLLDMVSTTLGCGLPSMTTTQKNAIGSPRAGLVVFDTTLAKACVYSGVAWQTITSI